MKNSENGAIRKLVSDSGGRYSAPALAVESYEISAEANGFSTVVKTGISLVVGQQLEVDLTLQVGEVKEAVTVVENATPVNLSTDQISGLVGEKQVKDICRSTAAATTA